MTLCDKRGSWQAGCAGAAERFFRLGDGSPSALCGPCTADWLRRIGPFRHPELTEAQYLELAEVREVMES